MSLQSNPAAPVPVRVLLAEDNAISAELLAMMARRLGITLDHASDGLETLRMVQAAANSGQPFMLLLMDAMMPVLDGVETARRLRSSGFCAAQLPIIAVTAATAPEELRAYTAAGMQAYLSKPVSLRDLQSALAAWGPAADRLIDTAEDAPQPSLRARYEERKSHTSSQIEQALAAERIEAGTIADIIDALHKLAGTAGSFGEGPLSEAAAECEAALLHAQQDEILDILTASQDRLRKAA